PSTRTPCACSGGSRNGSPETQRGGHVKRRIFTPEHDAFREVVRTFAEKEIAPHNERWEAAGIVDREVWLAAGGPGLPGIAVPGEDGGGGPTDPRYALVMAEELAKAGASGPGFSVHNDIIGPYLLSLATEEQQQRWLPGFCSGEIITAIAMSEPGAGSDLQGIRTTATPANGSNGGDGWILDGHKTFINHG